MSKETTTRWNHRRDRDDDVWPLQGTSFETSPLVVYLAGEGDLLNPITRATTKRTAYDSPEELHKDWKPE